MLKPQVNYAFIDSQNLNLGLKREGWKSLDYVKFRKYLSEKYGVKNAYMFIGYIPNQQSMYTAFQNAGYTLIFKPILSPVPGEKPKGNCDADLVLNTMIEYPNYQKAIIISSDGDFYSLVNYLYEKDKLEAVLSPCVERCSTFLRQSAKEKIHYLKDLKDRLEYINKK